MTRSSGVVSSSVCLLVLFSHTLSLSPYTIRVVRPLVRCYLSKQADASPAQLVSQSSPGSGQYGCGRVASPEVLGVGWHKLCFARVPPPSASQAEFPSPSSYIHCHAYMYANGYIHYTTHHIERPTTTSNAAVGFLHLFGLVRPLPYPPLPKTVQAHPVRVLFPSLAHAIILFTPNPIPASSVHTLPRCLLLGPNV